MKGKVEAVTVKGTGGIRINDTWFNGTQDTLETIKRLKKGAIVDFDITKEKYITKFNLIDFPEASSLKDTGDLILYQVCLKLANTHIAGLQNTWQEKADALIRGADAFYTAIKKRLEHD